MKLSKFERKRVFVLFCCLCFAMAAWLFMALNNTYVYTAKTILKYKDFPQKRAFKALQSDTVDLQIEGTGWQLLFARLRINPPSVRVSLEKLNQRNFVLFSEQLTQVNKQLESSQKVISVKPDTLYFDFSRRTSKRVPVKLLSHLHFAKQYGIASEITLKPAYVNISGPQEELLKISHWQTDTLKLRDLKQSLQTTVPIKANNYPNINIYPSNIGVYLPIDEFTEKTVEVPLNVINNKEFYDVRLFPKRVKITFLVALTRYHEVDADFIAASVDMDEWRSLKHPQLTVLLTRFPEYCNLVSITPQKIDYIVEK